MEWVAENWLGLVSAVASIWAAGVLSFELRSRLSAYRPHLTVSDCDPIKGHPRWVSCELVFTNRSHAAVEIIAVQVRRARGASIIDFWDVAEISAGGSVQIDRKALVPDGAGKFARREEVGPGGHTRIEVCVHLPETSPSWRLWRRSREPASVALAVRLRGRYRSVTIAAMPIDTTALINPSQFSASQ